jgi:hypothetical protein
VVSYGNGKSKREFGDSFKASGNAGMYGNMGTAASSGIHIGVMNQNDYGNDVDKNRNINMNELQDLLGI